MQGDERRTAVGSVAEARDQRMAVQPAVQGVAQAPFSFSVHDAHGALPAHERALDEGFGGPASLVPSQPVQVRFRHVAARLGQEEQAFERFPLRRGSGGQVGGGFWRMRHRFSLSAFLRRAG